MKVILNGIFILSLLASCQPNPSQRIRYAAEKQNNFSNSNNRNDYSGGVVNLPGRDDTSNDNNNNNNTGNTQDDWRSSLPYNVRNCRWSEDGDSGFSHSHNSIGAYTICQDTELEIYIQMDNPPPSSTPLCLIPTHTNDQRYTTYIGEPQCFPVYSDQQIYRITMVKNRNNIDQSRMQLNGVAMMKDQQTYYPFPYNTSINHPDAYLYCLQALEVYADARYCYAFDSVGQYVQHDFD